MSNMSKTLQLVESLVRQGCRHYVVCAGARNAPLVKVLKMLSHSSDICVQFYYEERAAAFLALGVCKALGEPAAVVTTSGTAVAELHPAMMEARYAGWPLVAVTADRPEEYRGTGAPQSVLQPNIFGEAAFRSYDFSREVSDFSLVRDQPVHLNICFDEPLLDEPLSDAGWAAAASSLERASDEAKLESAFGLQNFTSVGDPVSFSCPLVVIGGLKNSREKEMAMSALRGRALNIYAEASSGLFDANWVSGTSSWLKAEEFQQFFDGVIRVGGVPTTRLWRDLEKKLRDVPVHSFSDLGFSGLSRKSTLRPLAELQSFVERGSTFWKHSYQQNNASSFASLVQRLPNSEVSLIYQWAKNLPKKSQVLLGNSLCIRHWELLPKEDVCHLEVHSNRGVNGIDGLIATASGLAWGSHRPVHVLLGDLSALYDLTSLALVKRHSPNVRVVVVNNSGGQIFRKMFGDEDFINTHDLNFRRAAQMFSLSYADSYGPEPVDLLELKVSASESQIFERELS